MTRQLSPEGLAFIKSQEGCSLTPYQDPPGSGNLSVGYGHSRWTGGPISQQTADWLLEQDLRFFVACVNANVHVEIGQAAFDACVDFAYNEGAGAFLSSTWLRLLNAGDRQGAADAILEWDKVKLNGQLVPSEVLANRREKERQMLLSDLPSQPAA